VMSYLAATAVALRVFHTAAPPALVIALAIVVYVLVIALVPIAVAVNFWTVSAAYWFGVLCFLIAFGALYKSISIRILIDLLGQPHRRDEHQAVLDRYILRQSYEDRARLLIAEGFAAASAGGLALTPRGRRIAATVAWLHRVYNIAESG
jgi:hypothetical protein